MSRGDLREIIGPRRREAFHRRQRRLQGTDQFLPRSSSESLKLRPFLRSMQRRRLFFAKLGEFVPETREIERQAVGARLRPCPAQQRQFERFDRRTVRAIRRAEPAQRMLEQRQQCRRFQAVCWRLPPPDARRCRQGLDQRVAAGIVEVEIPACQRGHHPPRQRAVRRHQAADFCK